MLQTEKKKKSAPPKSTIDKLSLRHLAVIDDMIMNPSLTKVELSQRHGWTTQWFYNMSRSPVFLEAIDRRRDFLMDKMVVANLEDKYHNVLARSLDILAEKLQADPSKVNDNLLMKALEVSNKALRIGQKEEVKDEDGGDHLAKLANRLRELNQPQGVTYEVEAKTIEVVEVQPEAGEGSGAV